MSETTVRPVRVMIVIGSVRPHSRCSAAARYAARCVKEAGHEAFVVDPCRRPLPLADPLYHDDPAAQPDPAVQALVLAARLADAIVLSSPVYHNSFSAVLKNVLDHLTIDQFFYKPVGLLAHGRKLTAIQVCDQLRIVVRGLHGLCLPDQVVTTDADFAEGRSGEPELTGEDACDRIGRMTTALLKLASR